jgi:Fic family protein
LASSAIEGTFVTPEQLLLYEMDPKEPTSAKDSRADWLEVLNYSHALKAGCEMIETAPIGGYVIRSVHSILMHGVRGRDKSPGQYRQRQVQIGSSGRYIPPPNIEVPRLMQNLEEFINADNGLDPLIKSFIVHYQFEAIHPFEDGNGRVGRVILALMIYKSLGHSNPWLYLSAFFDEFRDEYVDNLFQVSTRGSWETWIEYCLLATISQANDSIDRCLRFNALRTTFQNRIKSFGPSPRSLHIIESLFTGPIIAITEVKRRFDITYHTARSDIDRLVSANILRELPHSRPRAFYSPEVMSIAFEPPE